MKTVELSMAQAWLKARAGQIDRILALKCRAFGLAIDCREAGIAKRLNLEIQGDKRRLKILQTQISKTPALPYEVR
jgi:hypothetical protein